MYMNKNFGLIRVKREGKASAELFKYDLRIDKLLVILKGEGCCVCI